MYYLLIVLLFITFYRADSFLFDRYSGKKVEIAQAKDLRLRNATERCSLTLKSCTPHEGSRIDGTCNNFKYPTRGSARGPYLRLLKPEYASNGDPRMNKHGKPLPSARKVRTELQTDGRVEDKYKFNIAGYHMLEFVNRDISILNGPYDYLRRRQYCCTPIGEADPRCYPIRVPKHDPYLKVTDIRCLNFSRAETFKDAGCTTEIIPPEQINFQTPVFDLSTIYGLDNKALRKVRKYEHGLLILEQRFDRYVPQNITTPREGLSPDMLDNIRNRIVKKLKQDMTVKFKDNISKSNMSLTTNTWANISMDMLGKMTPDMSDFLTDLMPEIMPDVMGDMINKVSNDNMTTNMLGKMSAGMLPKWNPNKPDILPGFMPNIIANIMNNVTMSNMTTSMWANNMSEAMQNKWTPDMTHTVGYMDEDYMPNMMDNMTFIIMTGDMLNTTAEILADTIANIIAESMVNTLLDMVQQFTSNVTNNVCLQNNNTEPVCYQFGYPEVGNFDLRTTTLTIFFMREHNRIARALHHMNPCWKDDRLFKVARQINIATASNIFMYELLPLLLGFRNMVNSGLLSENVEHVSAYKEDEVPLVYAEYEIAVRFFHTFLDGRIKTYKEDYHYRDEYSYSDTLFRPGLLEKGKIIEEVTRGMFHQYAAKIDDIQDPEISENFYGKRLQRAHDLPSIDIQRGRDLGIRGYNDYRHVCGLKPAKKFEDFLDVMDVEKVETLKKLYEVVDDVDLLAGIISENHIQGIYLGPTLFCIMTKQLHLFRYSDRFWFERGDQMHSFNLDQLHEIRKTNIARLACDNADGIKHIQPQAFLNVKPGNMPVPCTHIQGPDLTKWRDDSCYKHKYHYKASYIPVRYEHKPPHTTSTFYGSNREAVSDYSSFFDDLMSGKASEEMFYQTEPREVSLENIPYNYGQ